MNYSSIAILKQILSYNPTKNNSDSKVSSSKSNSSSTFCFINKTPNNILHIGNGQEYYHLELICNDNTEYGIQAYGEEAKALYEEVNGFSTSSHIREEEKEEKLLELNVNKKEEEQKKFQSVKKEVDYITSFAFNNINGYSLIFKKFKDVCISKQKKMMASDLPE